MIVKPTLNRTLLAAGILAAALLPLEARAALVLSPREAPVQPFLSRGNLYQKGENAFYLQIPAPGDYAITLEAHGDFVENDWPLLAVAVDGIERARIHVDSAEAKDYTRTLKLETGVHKIGFMLLNEAGGFFGRRTAYLGEWSITGPAEAPGLSTEEAWTAAAEAREKAFVAASKDRIAALRMGEGRIRLVDGDGAPMANTKLAIKQTRHAFLFGALLAGFAQYPTEKANQEYRDRFGALFNYATVPFYWALFEPERGKPNYAALEPMLQWCEARGIAMKGHTLLWDNEAGIPPWSPGQPSASEQERFVRQVMSHYEGRINYWEVVNEPANHRGVSLMPAHQWAREADPAAELVVNEYGIFYEGHPDFWTLLSDAIKAAVPFDAIGIQAHAPINMAFPLDRVWHILNRYAELGKAIHITEFTPGSNNTEVLGSPWRGRWTEAQQADYAEAFYRVCFAHPAVEAITWWDFADTGAWVTGGGMLRADRSPKPVYERLLKLIKEEWHTTAELETDAKGEAAFRGFYGAYEVAIAGKDGAAAVLEMTLEEDGADILLTVGDV